MIRQLPAVETLGGTSVICSDKTGTLTKDEMTVRRIVCGDSDWDVGGAGYAPSGAFLRDNKPTAADAPLKRLLQAGALAADAEIFYDDSEKRWRLKGDPTEGALVCAAAKAGLAKADLGERFPRVGEIPFSSESKRMTTLHRVDGDVVAYAKGAPEVILAGCAARLDSQGAIALDAESHENILRQAAIMAGQALRVLAVAQKSDASLENAERDMLFLGLVGMIDPPRPEAREAIKTCHRAGIKVVMITGDHPHTAQAVARELGLLDNGRVVGGAQLDAMDDAQLAREVESIDVYARVSPSHKLRVVKALQRNGHVTAMTGDGVNDAPALKQADIGIAMGISGTEVSREAAAMTLTDDNFASIVAAVEEGRAIFGNIKKYLMYLLSSNLGEIGLMGGAALMGLPMPLSAVQILYVNLATDGLPALALAVDPAETDLMRRRPRDARRGIFTSPVVGLMVAGGIWSALVNLCLFIGCLQSGRSVEQAMSMTFVALVLIQLFKAYNFRSDRHSVFRGLFSNRWLLLAVSWELIWLWLVVEPPWLQPLFGTVALSLEDWLVAGAVAASISPLLELVKIAVRRGWLGQDG
ncbi:cation-translocating P-type ATPase [Methylogaea oryzae]|uniref:cation-translocating P-type ATPase n=1 Tax=Methylogaea oryzae TaxID=1295382 RepID=UPI000A46593C|nr:cation-transporting P-type ATPase [Methylogaea oryzae]